MYLAQTTDPKSTLGRPGSPPKPCSVKGGFLPMASISIFEILDCPSRRHPVDAASMRPLARCSCPQIDDGTWFPATRLEPQATRISRTLIHWVIMSFDFIACAVVPNLVG